MRVKLGRIVGAVACLVWLAGCETTSTPNPFAALSDSNAMASGAPSVDTDTTGSSNAAKAEQANASFSNLGTPPALTPELLGTDPNDELAIGKKYYRQGSYGLAERHFRKAVELHPRDAESWVGLAAAYDQLRRFDLADRAYAQVIKLVGQTPEVMNNMGFSYMLRSDYRRARATLLAAQAQAPDDPHIAANLKMLAQAERKTKGIN